MAEQILTNARIVLADKVLEGTLVLSDGTISDIADGRSQSSSAVDCDGDYIIPGLIELHTDNLERHIMPRPGALWPTDAAVIGHDREIAAAGITTVLNAICVGEVHARTMRTEMLKELCEGVLRQIDAGSLKVDHLLHFRCEVSYGGLLALIEPLIELDKIRLISVMDHTPGQRQFVDRDRYAEYYQGKFGFSDAEIEEFVNERTADHIRYSASNRRSVVEMAQARGIVLASHDDATEGHVNEAVRDGIIIAEFPTTIESARASHEAGLAVLMGGPNLVRGKSNSGNVSARELADLGLLDIISSDYVPASLLYAAFVLETISSKMTLPEVIAMATRIPARQVGLDDRGEIAVGLRADLVRVKPSENVPVVRDVWRAGEKIA